MADLSSFPSLVIPKIKIYFDVRSIFTIGIPAILQFRNIALTSKDRIMIQLVDQCKRASTHDTEEFEMKKWQRSVHSSTRTRAAPLLDPNGVHNNNSDVERIMIVFATCIDGFLVSSINFNPLHSAVVLLIFCLQYMNIQRTYFLCCV